VIEKTPFGGTKIPLCLLKSSLMTPRVKFMEIVGEF